MGTRKKVTVKEPEVEGGIDADSLDDLSAEEQDALKAVLELEGAEDAKWKVFRIPPLAPGKTAGYCDTLTSSEMTMEELRARLGRGKYRIQGTRSNGTYISQKTIDIASDAPSTAVAVVQPNSTNDALTKFFEAQEKSAERRREMIMVALPAAIAALPAILQSFRGSNSTTDAVTLLAGLKQLTPEPPKQPDMTEFMFKILDFVKKLPSDKGGSGFMDVVKDGITELAPLLIQKLQGGTNPVTVALPSPALAPTSQPLSESATTQESPEMLQMLRLANWAKQILAQLTIKAAKNADPGLYADWVLDNVPDGVNIHEFAKYLSNPDWWQYLQQFSPGVAPYQVWFEQFRAELIAVYSEMIRANDVLSNGDNDNADV